VGGREDPSTPGGTPTLPGFADAPPPPRPRLRPPDEPPLPRENELQHGDRRTGGFGAAAAAVFPATDDTVSEAKMPAAASDGSGTAWGDAGDATAATTVTATAATEPPLAGALNTGVMVEKR